HPTQLRVARDAGIVDQDIDWSELCLDLLDAGSAGLERRHIPFVDVDTSLGFEFLRRFVAGAIIGRDVMAGCLQSLADRSANASPAAGDQLNAGHGKPPGSFDSSLPDNRCPMSDVIERNRPLSVVRQLTSASYLAPHNAIHMPPPMHRVGR